LSNRENRGKIQAQPIKGENAWQFYGTNKQKSPTRKKKTAKRVSKKAKKK